MPVRLPCAKRKLRSFRSIEPCGIDRAGEIGHEHAVAGNRARCRSPPSDGSPRSPARRLVVDRCAVHRVAARRVAAVGPVENAVLEIELEIDRLRQVVEEDFDVGAVAAVSPGGISIGAEDAAEPGIVRAFLRPVDLPALRVDRDADAPPVWSRRSASPRPVSTSVSSCEPSRLRA
jgi:hypothetical protein